jgi:hypothetical protein
MRRSVGRAMRRPRAMIAVCLLFLAPALGGCAFTDAIAELFHRPSPSPQLLPDLNKVQTDETLLFAQLQQPAPACSYASTSTLFTTVSTDLQMAGTEAKGGAFYRGVKNLEKTLSDTQTEVSKKTPCLDAKLAAVEQKAFEDGLNSLITAAKAKAT